MATPDDLVMALGSDIRTRAELQAQLGVSQPTMSRLLAAAGPGIARLGSGPAVRYAATRSLRRLGASLPMYRIDAEGSVHVFGDLVALAGGGYWCGFRERSGERHPDLPYFLADMCPQGFMGRAFAQRFAAQLELPPRLGDWKVDDHLIALAHLGDDLAGNLIVGDASLARFYDLHLQERALPTAARPAVYPQRARDILQDQPGSSAGGEQPKFTARIDAPAGLRQVIVKFSAAGDEPGAQRWRDLLRAEHHALQLLRRHDIAAAASELLSAEGRLFLEVERFDRVGAHGRRGLLSLAALDDHHFGMRGSWPDCAVRLQRIGFLRADEVERVRLLDTFGALIANTDRHFGNLSLFIDDFRSTLAPVYDMLPMAYRPDVHGEITATTFQPVLPTAQNRTVWQSAVALAAEYWSELADTLAFSADFRDIAGANAATMRRLAALQPPA